MENLTLSPLSRVRSDSILQSCGATRQTPMKDASLKMDTATRPFAQSIDNTQLWMPTPLHQRDNLLLRLPAELRNRIYEQVLGGRTYKFKDSVCTSHARLDTSERHIFGLLYVCRQIHFETALLPYSLNTFSFRDFDISLYPFLKERSPAQFRSIHSLELVTYQAGQMWSESELFSERFTEEVRIIARLPNLRYIRIIIDTMSSLYVGFLRGTLDFEQVRRNKRMLEDAIHTHRPDVIVTFWWA